MRHRLKCRKCSGKLEALFSNAERAASPNLTYQKWSEVPYHCKDGRVLSTRDFVSTPVTIEQFESDFAQCIESFLPHHTRAQVADQEWDYLWDHVHEFPNSVACVTDFSNSYLHKHKYEHMQQFWCEVSTTLLGCVMRIPIDNLADCYMPAEEKSRLRELLSKEGLPPLVTITHVLITPNPHHDTATVQHFWKEKLFPWIWDNTVGLEGGNMFVRSDNCGGQFKSGRHFRFISEHSSLPHSRGVRLLSNHFESCHGKDLSDPECGRCKFCLEMEEMRHTRERPTEMKTSREAFGFLRDNCESTDRSIFEKKGVGIYKRQFHWADSKEIKPLHRLAEVKTVHGSDSWHMFYDTGHVRHILVREIACFSCDQCKQMKWRSCSRLKMCGPTMSKEVILESANRVDAPLTANRITQDAKEMAKAVVSGAILGVECASEQEPYILVRAASQLYQHQGDDEYTWMGWIRAGDWLIDVVKFEKYSNTESFWCLKEEKRFPIFEEDLRSVITGYEVVKTRQSGRSTGAPPPMRVEVAGAEISKLQERVLFDLNSIAKEKDRPRRPSGMKPAVNETSS